MIRFQNNPTKNQRITSEFGKRDFAGLQFHSGVDLGAVIPGIEGDDLYAVADGVCKVSKVNAGNIKTGYGNYIIIEHESFCTLYGHLRALELKVGQRVKAGEIIGHMGNTGVSSAAHCHFEVRNCLYSHQYFWTKGEYTGQYIMCVNPAGYFKILEEREAKELTVDEAKKIIMDKAGLDENTIQYLNFYKYNEALLLKLARAMK